MSDETEGIFEPGGPLGERSERESEPSDRIAAQIREEQENANATRGAAICRGAKGLGADDAYGGYRGMWRNAEDEVQTLRAERDRQARLPNGGTVGDLVERQEAGGESDPTIDEAVALLRELSSALLHFYSPDKEQPPHVAAVERVISDLRNLDIGQGEA